MVVYWRAPEVRGRWVGVRQLAKHQAITLVADGRQGIANVSLSEIDRELDREVYKQSFLLGWCRC